MIKNYKHSSVESTWIKQIIIPRQVSLEVYTGHELFLLLAGEGAN